MSLHLRMSGSARHLLYVFSVLFEIENAKGRVIKLLLKVWAYLESDSTMSNRSRGCLEDEHYSISLTSWDVVISTCMSMTYAHVVGSSTTITTWYLRLCCCREFGESNELLWWKDHLKSKNSFRPTSVKRVNPSSSQFVTCCNQLQETFTFKVSRDFYSSGYVLVLGWSGDSLCYYICYVRNILVMQFMFHFINFSQVNSSQFVFHFVKSKFEFVIGLVL